MFFLTIMCFCFTMAGVTYVISSLLDNISISAFYSPLFATLGTIALVFHVDIISRDAIDAKKVAVLAVLSTGIILFQSLYFLAALEVFGQAIWIYYSVMLVIRAPHESKGSAWQYLVGVLFVAAGGGLGAATGIITTDTAATQAFLNFVEIVRWDMILGVGYMFIAISTVRNPELQNILPAVAVRLSLVDVEKGVLLYNHNFTDQEDVIGEDMFSSMIYGIGLILNEAVGKGNVREILLESGRLVIRRVENHPVACVLLVITSSRAVRMALDAFARELATRLPPPTSGPIEMTQFSFVKEMIPRHFPFVEQGPGSSK